MLCVTHSEKFIFFINLRMIRPTLTKDLRLVGGFLPCTLVSSTNKTDCHNITEMLLKGALNHKQNVSS